MAKRECRTLSEVFNADCRITNLNVTTNVGGNRRHGVEGVALNAHAQYELSQRPN